MNLTPRIQSPEARKDIFYLFDLGSSLADCKLLVNISISVVSLLSKEHEQNGHIVAQRILTDTEMRVLLPLLASPTCCPQEVLQASYHCTYEILLQSMFSSDMGAKARWNELVQERQNRLVIAHQQRARRVEMRGVYNALFGLRQKLEQLGLTVRSRRDGYYLSLL
jgi:hypothetical protein